MVQFMHLDTLVVAGRAQIKLLKALLASGSLSDEAKAKAAANGAILVPRLVEAAVK
jgi:molybdenum-dependent DNA-binding transcriptional regulator ModE